MSYLKKEYWISLFLILLFVRSCDHHQELDHLHVEHSVAFIQRTHVHWHPRFSLWCCLSLCTKPAVHVCRMGRHRSHHQIVVVISLNLFVQLIVTVFRHFSVTVLLSMICELCLVVLIAQWLFRFRRYSKEGLYSDTLGRRASFLPGNDIFHSALSQ